jgi:hypothetical protein
MRAASSWLTCAQQWIAAARVAALLLLPTLSPAVEVSSGLAGKLIVGYQGWFGCPGDFENNKLWQHWFVKDVAPQHFTVDLLPSVRAFDDANLCDTGLRRPDGTTIKVFSSQNAQVVATHFRWMREHGIDGAAVQRFVEFDIPGKVRRRDNVLKNIRSAAEASGRVFYVTYDISTGRPRRTMMDEIRKDWRHLAEDLKITASPSYLHDQGKPVLQLWGFGFGDRPGTPEEVAALIQDLKEGRNGLQAVFLVGGVPTHWRTLSGDSKSDPGWARVYRSYDVISPWSVGRYVDDEGADAFVRDNVLPDLAETRRLGIGYMPVIFPGFSWHNLMTNRNRGGEPHGTLNRIPRRCGKFLWHQVSNLLDVNVSMIYLAMFDEVDEGTAVFPTETRMDKLPVGANMVFLNQDGCALPDDWYLRVAGKAANALHAAEVPPQNLDALLQP